MSPEGQLHIRLHCGEGSVARVGIVSSRPLRLSRVFHGLTPPALLKTLPRLYSLCGTAQVAAAHRACRQALQQPADRALDVAQHLLVDMETAREHLWRMLVDWPRWLDEEPSTKALAPLGRLLPELRRALFGDGEPFALDARPRCDRAAAQIQLDALERLQREQVFGMPANRWLDIGDPDAFVQWLADTDTAPARLLRTVQREDLAALGRSGLGGVSVVPDDWLAARLADDGSEDFAAQPHWQGQPCETGALDRQRERPLLRALSERYGNGLLPRLTARLLELAAMSETLRDGLATLADIAPDRDAEPPGVCEGEGVGQVEAARGRLVHRLVLASGQVRDYRILAPTEWNFHPDGVLARGLTGLERKPEPRLRREVALLINAIDPCVGYRLEMC